MNCHDASPAVVAKDFDMDAVMAGFKAVSRKTYEEVHAEIEKTADGIDVATGDPHMGGAHPVSCLDCHDPDTMEIRVLRPGFILGIDKLAKSDDPVPHLSSIGHWRATGPRATTIRTPWRRGKRCVRSCAADVMLSITVPTR